MPKHGYDTAKWDALAQCPYFRRSDKVKHRIVCEGLSEDTRISLSFLGTEAQRVRYLSERCCDRFTDCPIFTACGMKYEKQED